VFELAVMNILTFTTLFPNAKNPDFGIFIKNRMKAVSLIPGVQLKVVAPVPWFPPINISKKWYGYSQIPKYEVIDGIEVYHPRYLVTPKIGMTLYGFWMFIGSFWCVKRLQKTFKFDLIDAHYVYPDGLAAILLGKVLKKPVSISARGTDVNLYPKIPVVKNLLRWVLKSSDQLVSVSASLGQLMVNEGADEKNIAVISNGVDCGRFQLLPRGEARKTLNLPHDENILLSVGGLIERKGMHLLVEAIFILAEKGFTDFKTYIIGKGEMADELKRRIAENDLADRVFLLGQIPNEQLVDWYNAADLFFLGSSREGWPNVVCEALACGTPVVATDVNGIPEILDDEQLGIMVKRTAEVFADGIYEAFSRSWNYDFIVSKGQSRTWDNVANDVYAVFSKVLNHAKN